MAKLIAVSDDLYRRLSMRKREGQSFTKVIGAMLDSEAGGISDLKGMLDMDDAEVDAWQARILRDRKNFFQGRKHGNL